MKGLAMSCAVVLAAAGGTFTSAWFAASMAMPAAAAETAPQPRVEARSTDLLAVGLVHDDRMSIHLSRQIDNAPVRDAAVTVVLRGISHPTTAETDGSYTLQTKDLGLPGSAAIEFLVMQASGSQNLKGTLQIASAERPDDKNNARQLWWWVLNFAVCIGFLMLLSRRRKRAQS